MVAENADFIVSGCKEIVRSVHKVRDIDECLLRKKMKLQERKVKRILEWYKPYIFITGLGIERFNAMDT